MRGDDVAVIELPKRPWWSSLAIEIGRARPVGTSAFAMIAGIIATGDVGIGAAVGAALAVCFGVAAMLARAPGGPATVSVEADHIVIGDERIPVAELGSGRLESVGGQWIVSVDRRWHLPLRFEVPAVEEGRALIERLSAGLARRPFETSMMSFFGGRWLLAGGIGLFSLPYVLAALTPRGHLGQALAVWPILLLIAAALRMTRSRLTVGADAVVHRWLWRSAHWPVADIVSVERVAPSATLPHRLRLHLTGGRSVDLPVGSGGLNDPRTLQLARTVIERIESAMRARRASGPAHFSEWNASLAVRGPEGWLSGLREAPDTYRAAAPPFGRGDLLAVVRDGRAPVPDRVAAAVALASDPDAREELRAAGRATAHPEVARAIASALDDDAAALTALLAGLLTAQQRPRVRVAPDDEAIESPAGEAEEREAGANRSPP